MATPLYAGPGPCTWCGTPCQSRYSIPETPQGGPEWRLCDGCGRSYLPTLAMVWQRIAEIKARKNERSAA
jgi:hypothetical protein